MELNMQISAGLLFLLIENAVEFKTASTTRFSANLQELNSHAVCFVLKVLFQNAEYNTFKNVSISKGTLGNLKEQK